MNPNLAVIGSDQAEFEGKRLELREALTELFQDGLDVLAVLPWSSVLKIRAGTGRSFRAAADCVGFRGSRRGVNPEAIVRPGDDQGFAGSVVVALGNLLGH